MAVELKPSEFLCEACGGIFEKGWSEEESIDELRKKFDTQPKENDVILCENCYKKLGGKIFN